MRLAALLLLFPLGAGAMDYDEYAANLKTDAGRAAVRVWMDGFGRGVGMFDTRQQMDGRARRFCLPQGTRYSPELLVGLVDKVIRAQPHLAKPEMPVEALIWTGLEVQFPCPKPKTG